MILNPFRKPNSTPVARHLNSSKPLVDKKVLAPAPTPKYERPMARLSFGVITPKEDRTIRELFEAITCGQIDPKYIFPDTGFITTPIQKQFWGFGDHRVVAFTEMTAGELTGWLQNPMHNSYLQSWLPRALEKCKLGEAKDGPLSLTKALGTVGTTMQSFTVGLLSKAELSSLGADYYVNLLSIRKRLGIRVANQLRVELGRDPAEVDVRNRLNRDYHSRIAPIAFKGWKDQGKRNFSADEELVVSAVITAIMTGETTLILTRDTDLFDQFAKLCEMITADYMCFRFAVVRHLNPDGIPMGQMQIPPNCSIDHGFCGTSVDQIMITHEDTERLPPDDYTPVHCFCVLVGNHCHDPKISIAGYCLEKEMSWLLSTKGETNGRNTAHFSNKNVVIGMRADPGKLWRLFMIGEEKTADFEGVTVQWHDLHHVLQCDAPIIRKTW